MLYEIQARILVDVPSKKSAEFLWAKIAERLPDDMPCVAAPNDLIVAEGAVSPSQMMPLVTGRDVDREMERVVEMARTINRHAHGMEERLVEARLNLTHSLHRDLNRVIDTLSGQQRA